VDSSQVAPYPGRPGLHTEPRRCRKDRRLDSAADQRDRNRVLLVDSPEVAAAAADIGRRHCRLSPQGQTRSQECWCWHAIHTPRGGPNSHNAGSVWRHEGRAARNDSETAPGESNA
jgi:hypothetical protein